MTLPTDPLELTRLAALAGGYKLYPRYHWNTATVIYYELLGSNISWHPLGDDGDAYRLAVACRIHTYPVGTNVVAAQCEIPGRIAYASEPCMNDAPEEVRCDALRRAVVRCAVMGLPEDTEIE